MARRPILRESAIQAAVIAHWRALGLPETLVAAIPNAGALGQAGLTAGLSDLLVLGGAIRIGFIELKTDRGVESEHQARFRIRCEHLGIPCVVTHGRDEPIAVLERWGVVRPHIARAA
ncbi:hypothetical protein [Methylobacterium organophilum]|uniref:VRR-NUC domain-containing protein n=1 Tax=Methylobacterium organophilum TaxID=410 RepID=A0ABQ4TFC9_METOR|nr:hypothetical protein [Methylobacterium organophilum]GJE29756.1 hypothetical protein LKMONMHP_4642 [Methylobacterium organophilum]